jgi:general secretion pathway protein I
MTGRDRDPDIHKSPLSSPSRCAGFTLLEVLVAVAILGIAVAVILQLFSADLRAIAVSGHYVDAATKAEAKMRELLDDDTLAERSSSELTNDGYRIDVSVTPALGDRTENLPVRLLDISLTVRWIKGTKERALSLRTMKMVNKQI